MPRHQFHYCRAQVAHAVGFRPPPPPAPSRPVPLWTHDSPRYCGPPCRLGQPTFPPAPVIRTCGARLLRDRVWRRWCRRYASVGSLRCFRPPTFPAVGTASPLSSARLLDRRLRRRRLAPRLLGWWGGVRLLPTPACPPSVFLLPWWSLLGVCPPRATQSLWGFWCPVATSLPRPLHVGTPVGFPPL